jgi:hypothetical protein
MHTDTPVAGWVEQLGIRQSPQDIARLTSGYNRIILVITHEVGSPTPEKDWLDHHAHPAQPLSIADAKIVLYDFSPATIQPVHAMHPE